MADHKRDVRNDKQEDDSEALIANYKLQITPPLSNGSNQSSLRTNLSGTRIKRVSRRGEMRGSLALEICVMLRISKEMESFSCLGKFMMAKACLAWRSGIWQQDVA